jgi:hypothetical protein
MAELTTIVNVVHGCDALRFFERDVLTDHASRVAKRAIKIRNEASD